jgi:deoxyribonuclease V
VARAARAVPVVQAVPAAASEMSRARPDLAPDPEANTDAMRETQRAVAAAARFDDDCPTPAAVAGGDALVVGVDQAFLSDPDRAVSAAVALRGGRVVERVHAVSPLAASYVPGLLAFREGGPALGALARLDPDPDLLVVDGSGRIHPRQAGLATHLGVVLGVPAVGVAKSLLCGTPDEATDGRPAGWRTPVRAGDGVDAPARTLVGHAYQSRQFDSGVVNPLYVSPGHRASAETATDLVAACGGDYKLPEPTRLADRHAAAVVTDLDD